MITQPSIPPGSLQGGMGVWVPTHCEPTYLQPALSLNPSSHKTPDSSLALQKLSQQFILLANHRRLREWGSKTQPNQEREAFV